MTTEKTLAQKLTTLRSHSKEAWESLLSRCREMLLRAAPHGDEDVPVQCEEAMAKAMQAWDEAIRHADGGCLEGLLRAVDRLELARGIADEWGSCAEEVLALELVHDALLEVAA